MKKLFPIILLALFIACLSKIANGQYMHTRPLWVSVDSTKVELLDIRFRQVVVQELVMGKKAVYIPETNVEQGNSLGDKTKVISYQVAMSDSITTEMMAGIKRAIDSIMFWKPIPVPVIIDTVDAEVSTFTGTWRIGDTSAPGWMFNTIAYSNTTGSEATYQGEFSKIEIYGEKFTSHGICAISIDGGEEILVDLYSPTRILPALLHTFNVPKGMHEVKVRITGTKNAASTGTFGLLDFYRLTR